MQGLSAARSRYESKVLQAGLGIDSEIRACRWYRKEPYNDITWQMVGKN